MPQTHPHMLVNGMTITELLATKHAEFGDLRMEDDPLQPQRPADVPQEEWDALGDPGRRALDRVRRARDTAVSQQQHAAQERDAARTLVGQRETELEQARQAAAAAAAAAAGTGNDGDVAGQIQAAVATAVQQVTEQFTVRIEQLTANQAAERLATRAQQLAAEVLIVPDLVGSLVDLSAMTDGQGALNEQALRDGLASLVETRPELRRPPTQTDRQNPYGGHPGGARPPAEKATFDARVAQQLQIARQSGLAVRSDLAASSNT